MYVGYYVLDHNIYHFDLRKTDKPKTVYKGHKKAVSYAKFINEYELISA